MQTPVSIVLTSIFKNPDSFTRAWKSCANQIYQSFELIVVLDGVNENVFEYLKGQNLTEPENLSLVRTKFINIPPCRRGPGILRNLGVIHANGEYICFVSDDGELDPFYLEEMMKRVNNENVQDDIIICKTEEVFEDSFTDNGIEEMTEIIRDTIIKNIMQLNFYSGCFVVKKVHVENNPWILNPFHPYPTNTLFSKMFVSPLRINVINQAFYRHHMHKDMFRFQMEKEIDSLLVQHG